MEVGRRLALVLQALSGWTLMLAWGIASAEATLVLKKEFIEKYKNRATIEVDFSVMYAHKAAKKPSPSKPSNDGDIHIAGIPRAVGQPNEIIMTAVAEIMNAKDFPKELKYIQDKKSESGQGDSVRMVGVWRFWPEHGGESHHSQGLANISAIEDTNPDHIFEIHPLVRIDNFDLQRASSRSRISRPRMPRTRSATMSADGSTSSPARTRFG